MPILTTSGSDLRLLPRRHLCSNTDSLGMRRRYASRTVIAFTFRATSPRASASATSGRSAAGFVQAASVVLPETESPLDRLS